MEINTSEETKKQQAATARLSSEKKKVSAHSRELSNEFRTKSGVKSMAHVEESGSKQVVSTYEE